MDGFTQQEAALVEAASIAAEATSNASAAACIATTRASWDVRDTDTDTPRAAQAACDTQRILDTIRIAMSLTAPPPRGKS